MSEVIHQVECFMDKHKWFCKISVTAISAFVTTLIVTDILIKVLA